MSNSIFSSSNGNAPGALSVAKDLKFIGDIIKDTRNLSVAQVEEILEYQRTKGVRFGEAAIALGHATQADVIYALASQFNYAIAGGSPSAISKEVIAYHQPFGVITESFRAARAQITLAKESNRASHQADVGLRTAAIAITSSSVGDGKSFFCANLAVVLAQSGKRTLLVDADLRGGRQSALFGVEDKDGLVALLSGRSTDVSVQSVQGISNLYVLPTGTLPPNPQELLESSNFSLLLHELQSKFDHVVVDTSAQSLGADYLVVSSRCQNALIIGRKDRTKIGDSKRLIQDLKSVGALVVGVIMNEY